MGGYLHAYFRDQESQNGEVTCCGDDVRIGMVKTNTAQLLVFHVLYAAMLSTGIPMVHGQLQERINSGNLRWPL